MIGLVLTACAPVKQFDVDLELVDQGDLPGDEVGGVGFEVKLYDDRDSWYLPAYVDVENFGAVLLADRVLRAAGQPDVLTVDVSGLTLISDAPLVLGFDVVAEADGLRFVPEASSEVAPARPAACALTVDDATTDAQHAADLLSCLQAWVDVLGAPVVFHLEVSVVQTEATDFELSATYALDTAQPTVAACSGPSVADDTFQAEADNVDLSQLQLAGYAISEREPLTVVAFENTWAATEPLPVTGGVAWGSMQGNGGVYFGADFEIDASVPQVPMAGPEPVDTFPSDWIDASVDALRGPDGFVDACWVGIHDALPNETWVHFALIGEGTYVGGG